MVAQFFIDSARWVSVLVLIVFSCIIGMGASALPGGYDGSGGLNAWFLALPLVALGGVWLQRRTGLLRLGKVAETLALYLLLCLVSMLATGALAIYSGTYIDPVLIQADAAIFPWFDWLATVRWLSERSGLFTLASHVYGSLTWQPVALIVAAAVWGRPSDLSRLSTSWALGLALCILPFAWLPAQSPYIWYGLQAADLPDLRNALPFTFFPVLEGLRDGTTEALSLETMTGMVTVPSFHACGAALLAWLWWPFQAVRWPMLFLNIGMALAAIPIGSHYVIDIVAGLAVAVIAIAATRALIRPSSPFDASASPHLASHRGCREAVGAA